jgi:thioredoxin 1
MSENILTLTKSNFDSEVKKPGAPILVDFWAEWCGPCRMVAPVLEKLAAEYGGRVRIGKVNVDDESGLAASYGIQSIPTLLLFKDGRVVEQFIGATSRDVLARMIEKHAPAGA